MTDRAGFRLRPFFMEADMAEVVFVGTPTDQKKEGDAAPAAEKPAKKAKKAK